MNEAISPRNDDSPRADIDSPRSEVITPRQKEYEQILKELDRLSNIVRTNKALLITLNLEFEEEFLSNINRCVSRLDAVLKNGQLTNSKLNRGRVHFQQSLDEIKDDIKTIKHTFAEFQAKLEQLETKSNRRYSAPSVIKY